MNSKCGWSASAYEWAFTARPDWTRKVIADLNSELPVHARGRKDAVRCVYEYTDFLEEFITGLPVSFFTCQPYLEGAKVLSPIQTWSGDFSMTIGGIPSMVNDFSTGEFMETHHHSQYDNENLYQKPVYRFYHGIYVGFVLAFGKTAAVPMSFTRLFEGAADSIDGSVCRGAGADLPGLHVILDKEVEAGEAPYEKIREINRAYGRFLDRDEGEKAIKPAARCRPLNREFLRIFRKGQDYFVRLSWHNDVPLPQRAVQENVKAMDRAIARLENHDPTEVLEAVYTVDNNCYALLFEKEVHTYLTEYALNQPADRLKWEAGRVVHHQNLSRLVESLKIKTVEENPDTQEEYEVLVKARENQLCRYEDDIRYMMASTGKLPEAARKAGQWALNMREDLDTDKSKIREE